MWAIWNHHVRDWIRDHHGRVRRFDNIVSAFGALAQEDDYCCEVQHFGG